MAKRKRRLTKRERKAVARRQAADERTLGRLASIAEVELEAESDDAAPCARTLVDHVCDHIHKAGLALSDLVEVARAALSDWPETPATAELRTLLGDIVGVATRGREVLHATYVRGETFVANAPHLHLVDNQVVIVVDDDATAASTLASHEAPAM